MSLVQQVRTWSVGHTDEFMMEQIHEELDFHIQSRIDDLIASGSTQSEASQKARLEFGDSDGYAKACRRVQVGKQTWLNRLALAGLVFGMIVIAFLGWTLLDMKNQNSRLVDQLSSVMASTHATPAVRKNDDFKGQVVDANRFPVANAKVLLLHKSWPNGYRQAAYSTTTDDEGRYTFAKRYSSSIQNAFLVTILAEGHVMSARYEVFEAGKTAVEFDFALERATSRAFTFVNANDEPLAGAQVSISNRISDGQTHLIYHISREAATWETDDDGIVSLPFFKTGDKVEFSTIVDGKSVDVSVVVKEITEEGSQKVVVGDDGDASDSEAAVRVQPDPVANDKHRVQWIKENAIGFDSIDPNNTDFSDLQELKEWIGDARIVQLGEQSHGDGASFETKIRLIKFLHQEMGFDVLAFESGLYDCDKAWQAFKGGADPHEAAEKGVFRIWTGSAQTGEMWKYLADQSSGNNPLELAGFDCQFTGTASRELRNDLADLVDALDGAELADDQWETFDQTLGKLIDGKPPIQSKQDFIGVLDRIQAALNRSAQSDDPVFAANTTAFWIQQLMSMKDHCGRQWDKTRVMKGVMARDAQMARNLIWLANDRFHDRRIIVWAASFHIMRNPSGIKSLGGAVDYSNTVQMGQLVHETFGDDVYTIGFTAYDGRAGAYFRNKFSIGEAPEGTLESLCAESGMKNGMIPFRGIGDTADWLHQKLFARPMGYSWMEAVWPEHFDAMVLNLEMTPSTGR